MEFFQMNCLLCDAYPEMTGVDIVHWTMSNCLQWERWSGKANGPIKINMRHFLCFSPAENHFYSFIYQFWWFFNLFWAFSIIFEIFLVIFDYFWSFRIFFDHLGSFLIIFDHFLPFLIIPSVFDHFFELSQDIFELFLNYSKKNWKHLSNVSQAVPKHSQIIKNIMKKTPRCTWKTETLREIDIWIMVTLVIFISIKLSNISTKKKSHVETENKSRGNPLCSRLAKV